MRKAFSLSFIGQTLIVLGCLYGVQFVVGMLSAVRLAQSEPRLTRACGRAHLTRPSAPKFAADRLRSSAGDRRPFRKRRLIRG